MTLQDLVTGLVLGAIGLVVLILWAIKTTNDEAHAEYERGLDARLEQYRRERLVRERTGLRVWDDDDVA